MTSKIQRGLGIALLSISAAQVPASSIVGQDDYIPANLQPAIMAYSVVASKNARPMNVFGLHGNLYVQLPKGIKASRVVGYNGTSNTAKLLHQIEYPYLVVRGGIGGASIQTNRGTIKIAPRQQASATVYFPAATTVTPVKTASAATTAQVKHIDNKLTGMDQDVDNLIGRLNAPRKTASTNYASHTPTGNSRYKWRITPGTLRANLSSTLSKLGYKLVWQPSLDFNVGQTTLLEGNDVADLLRPVADQYGLPMSLCRAQKQVIVHSFGTPASKAACPG